MIFRDLDTDIQWEVSEPFLIKPEVTFLKSGEKKTFKATFKPDVSTHSCDILQHSY